MNRERLFILLEAAGFEVFHTLREYNPVITSRHIGWAGIPNDMEVSWIFGVTHPIGQNKADWMEKPYKYRLTIAQLEENLIEMIKNESKE